MGRTQIFQTHEVVTSALQVFWAVGYENASIPELEKATGLNRSSIYHSFGSKRGLFDAAVEVYLEESVRPLLGSLRSEQVPPSALADYLVRLETALATDTLASHHGCLLVNASRSPLAADPALHQQIVGYLGELKAAFRRGLEAAGPSGNLATRTETMTGLVVAAFAMVRVEKDQALSFVRAAMSALPD